MPLRTRWSTSGNLHIGTGHPEQARPYYLEALDLLRTLNDHRALGILYNNLALQEAREQQWKEALESFAQALSYHRMVGNEEGLAVTYSQMGRCFLDQGDLVSAERCLNNGSEHYIKLGAEVGEAAVLRVLADLYSRRGDLAFRRPLPRTDGTHCNNVCASGSVPRFARTDSPERAARLSLSLTRNDQAINLASAFGMHVVT